MKSFFLFLLLALPVICLADGAWYSRVALGPLKLGMAEAEIVASLGEPTEKSKPHLEGATGLYVSQWSWPKQGVVATFASETETGARALDRLRLTALATFKTPEAIGIGSTADAVLAAYRKELDPETPPTQESIVLGSLFGGMILTLEKGVVVEIFLGAAAE